MRHRTTSKKVTSLSHSNFLCQFENFSHQSINQSPTNRGRRPNEASTMPKTKTHQSDRGCIWLG